MAYKELKTKHLQNYRSAKNYPVFLTNNTMKKLSETLTELGIGFTFPIKIWNVNGRATYYENSDGFWYKYERDANGNETYYENSKGFWYKCEYNDNGNETYFEDSDGYKVGTPRSAKTREGKGVEIDGIKYELKAL